MSLAVHTRHSGGWYRNFTHLKDYETCLPRVEDECSEAEVVLGGLPADHVRRRPVAQWSCLRT